ncbi:MAG: SdrD B-like domain-containing protein, partial [Peptoniphilus harei]|nr:SdrD B-like domain-containing protein [Peptoniphilus harei]
MRKNKKIISLLILMLMIVGVFATDKLSVFAEIGQNDFDVNTGWTMSGDITTGYTVKNGNRAYSTGEAKIGDIGVTATFVKQADRNDGASYLSANGNNQAAYGATEDMFYGNPDPASIPALGMNTQPSNGCGGPLGSWEKYNADGEYEVGSVTFKFDRKVTDPILDLSGLGGYVSRVGSYVSNGRMILVGLGSFNSTNLHLATEGITVEPLTSNSNLVVDNNIIQVKDRNTHTRAVVEDNSKYNWIQFGDAYGRQYNVNSPSLVPAGTGSVKLKGTFDKVTFKLYHQATPYSDFSREEYGTHSSYFANSIDGNPANGDGINGMNVINTESVKIGGQLFNGDQNWDLFRASLRLLKPSSIGDKVWLDENKDGIQNAGEAGVEGVTVKLLDKDGSPAKDFNGNLVQDQVTDANGNYKFENLPAGEYVVQVVTKDGQTLTTKGQGAADKDSDLDPKTGKTDVIKLEANENITNVDAGIVPAKEYKVDYEFQPSKAEGTPEKLPEEVLKQLPEAKEKLKDGSEVPSPKEFTAVKDEVNKGTWTFEAWDKETAKIDGKDEHVTGTWVFTKDKEYKVDYEFQPSKEAGTPSELPQGVKDQLPNPV